MGNGMGGAFKDPKEGIGIGLKKGKDGWWYCRRTAWNARRDNCWDEEGWFPSSYVDGDLYAQKNPSNRWTGGRAGEDDWETVHTSSSDSESEDEAPRL